MGNHQSPMTYATPLSEVNPDKHETPIYRRVGHEKELVNKIEDAPEVKTLQDLYLRTFDKYAKSNALGTRDKSEDGKFGDYKFKTYEEVKELVLKLGNGIKKLKLAPVINEYKDWSVSFIGIYSKNREEYLIADFAASLFGYTSVPIYDTFGAEAVQYIFEQTHLSTLFCSNDYLELLMDSAKDHKLGKVSTIVTWEPYSNEEKKKFASYDVKLLSFEEVIKAGNAEEFDLPDLKSDDLVLLSYTSGTTAMPKATMITHGNFISALAGAIAMKDPHTTFRDTDVYLSYLPLAHIFERFALINLLFSGACIGFYSGDKKLLKEDLAALKPTVFTSVPRVYNKIYEGIMDEVEKQNGLKRLAIEAAIKSKIRNLKSDGSFDHALYDKIIFNKMREVFGGRVRLLITGAAAMESDRRNFFKVAMGCPMIEGYGHTETCAGCFATHSLDQSSGNVGGPSPCLEVKLVDEPEMHYTAMDKDDDGEPTPRGEICLRGNNVFKGYYKEDKKTEEAIDSDGWFHTGDIGMIDKYGKLTILDRKKNIFKLAQGEYLAPEKIENVLLKDKLFQEVFIHGESKETYCILIAVPSESEFKSFCSSKGAKGDMKELCEDKEVLKEMKSKVAEICKAGGLNGFETPQKVLLRPESFAKDDLMTATTKVKRNDVKEFYKEEIEKLYKDKEDEIGGDKGKGGKDKKDKKKSKETDDHEEKKVEEKDQKKEEGDDKKDMKEKGKEKESEKEKEKVDEHTKGKGKEHEKSTEIENKA